MMRSLREKIEGFIQEEEGASAVEYALVVSGIAVTIVAGVYAFGGALNNYFNALFNKVNLK